MAVNIDENRFWSKVKKGADDACWDWTAGRFQSGYGAFYVDGRNVGSHRIAWMLTNGSQGIPDQMQVCHTCDRPQCCNPSHLFLGTTRDNWDDCVAKGRRAHVKPLGSAAEHRQAMPRGSSHWTYKRFKALDEDTVRAIKRLLAEGLRQCDIMRRLGLPRRTVQRIAARKTWGHIE